MTRILVMSRSVVGRNMASPGVRAFHIARVLAEQLPDAKVTLSVRNEPDIPSPHPNMSIVRYGNAITGLPQMMRHDVIISREFPALVLAAFPKRLILDFYTPSYTERMEFSRRYESMKARARYLTANRRFLEFQLTMADYVLCSSESLRDFWIGVMSNIGLITPRTYDENNTLRRLIDVVPYGVQAGEPEHKRPVVKGVMPGINKDDKLLIWNGVLIEWFDALTVVKAMAEVARKRPDVKLLFMGTNHPEAITSVGAPPVQAAIELSKELGLYGASVFFNEGWVPYEEIGSYLSEADIGVCASFDNLESRFAYRTRFVDLFWARLPTVCTRGDELGDRIGREPLGVAVPHGDSHAFAAAILRLLDDEALYEQCRSNLGRVKEELSWENVLSPLVDYIRSGESVAASKRQRLVPALERMTTHMVAKLRAPLSF